LMVPQGTDQALRRSSRIRKKKEKLKKDITPNEEYPLPSWTRTDSETRISQEKLPEFGDRWMTENEVLLQIGAPGSKSLLPTDKSQLGRPLNELDPFEVVEPLSEPVEDDFSMPNFSFYGKKINGQEHPNEHLLPLNTVSMPLILHDEEDWRVDSGSQVSRSEPKPHTASFDSRSPIQSNKRTPQTAESQLPEEPVHPDLSFQMFPPEIQEEYVPLSYLERPYLERVAKNAAKVLEELSKQDEPKKRKWDGQEPQVPPAKRRKIEPQILPKPNRETIDKAQQPYEKQNVEEEMRAKKAKTFEEIEKTIRIHENLDAENAPKTEVGDFVHTGKIKESEKEKLVKQEVKSRESLRTEVEKKEMETSKVEKSEMETPKVEKSAETEGIVSKSETETVLEGDGEFTSPYEALLSEPVVDSESEAESEEKTEAEVLEFARVKTEIENAPGQLAQQTDKLVKDVKIENLQNLTNNENGRDERGEAPTNKAAQNALRKRDRAVRKTKVEPTIIRRLGKKTEQIGNILEKSNSLPKRFGVQEQRRVENSRIQGEVAKSESSADMSVISQIKQQFVNTLKSSSGEDTEIDSEKRIVIEVSESDSTEAETSSKSDFDQSKEKKIVRKAFTARDFQTPSNSSSDKSKKKSSDENLNQHNETEVVETIAQNEEVKKELVSEVIEEAEESEEDSGFLEILTGLKSSARKKKSKKRKRENEAQSEPKRNKRKIGEDFCKNEADAAIQKNGESEKLFKEPETHIQKSKANRSVERSRTVLREDSTESVKPWNRHKRMRNRRSLSHQSTEKKHEIKTSPERSRRKRKRRDIVESQSSESESERSSEVPRKKERDTFKKPEKYPSSRSKRRRSKNERPRRRNERTREDYTRSRRERRSRRDSFRRERSDDNFRRRSRRH